MHLKDKIYSEEGLTSKAFFLGTHRLRTPKESLDLYLPLAPKIGLTRLSNITGLDTINLPVWVGIRPNSKGLSTSQGKGSTNDAAKISALMESIENWHAENINLPCYFDSVESLSTHSNIISLEGLSYYSDRPLRPDSNLAWIEGYDLIKDQDCWIPYETVSTNYVVSEGFDYNPSFVQSSNGLSGGNHIVEAVNHALFELVERHSLALMSEALRSLRADTLIDIETIDCEHAQATLDLLVSANVGVVISDLTSKIGIPVLGCTIYDIDQELRWRVLPPFSGYGCHLSPSIALQRAINEAVQSRLTYISGSRDDIPASEYLRGRSVDALDAFRKLAEINKPMKDFKKLQDLSSNDFHVDLRNILDRLKKNNVKNAVVIDLSREGFNVPVVKVIASHLLAPTPLIKGRKITQPNIALKSETDI